jgi:hypothetical protein
MIIKQVGKHHKGCYSIRNYLNGTWDTPWALLGERWFFLDRRSAFVDGVVTRTKSGNVSRATRYMNKHRWLRAICNNLKCNAILLISADSVLADVHNKGNNKWIR